MHHNFGCSIRVFSLGKALIAALSVNHVFIGKSYYANTKANTNSGLMCLYETVAVLCTYL